MLKIQSNNAYLKKYIIPNKKSIDYIFNSSNKTFNVVEGTVRSAKTTDNITAFCIALEKSRDMLHLAIAQTQSSAKTILFDGEGLGIQHYPDWQERVIAKDGKRIKIRQRIFKGKYEGNDALILLPKYGSNHPIKYIVAFGGDKIDSHETYKGYSTGLCIATQWELLHENTRNEVLKRSIAASDRKFFIDNNPTDPNHPIYKQYELWERAGQLNFSTKIMMDNPALTQERIDLIKQEYDPESVDYQRDIEGKRVSAQGTIYRVRDYNIIDDIDLKMYSRYLVVADIGINNSATVYQLIALSKDRKYIDVLKRYGHKNSGNRNLAIKMPIDYAKDLCEFIIMCDAYMGYMPIKVISDLDVTFKREFDRIKNQYGLGGIYLDDPIKEKIDDRIKTGINLLWLGRLRFSKELTETIQAFRTAVYNPKASANGVYERYDNPSAGTMIDDIDPVEYGFSEFALELSTWKGV